MCAINTTAQEMLNEKYQDLDRIRMTIERGRSAKLAGHNTVIACLYSKKDVTRELTVVHLA